jgi:hypothetical protein
MSFILASRITKALLRKYYCENPVAALSTRLRFWPDNCSYLTWSMSGCSFPPGNNTAAKVDVLTDLCPAPHA